MKNEIDKIFDDITDEELVVLLNELSEFKVKGVIPNEANLRKLIDRIIKHTGNTYSVEIIGVSYKLFEKGANKWVNVVNK